nr:hypothetical protein [Tanacetum cinerariifolium]
MDLLGCLILKITQSMNYEPVAAGNQPNSSTGIQGKFDVDVDAAFNDKENESEVHVSPSSSDKPKKHDEKTKNDEEDVGAKADFSNLETSITISPIPTTRVHKDHPTTQIIGDLSSAPQTRSMTRMVKEQARIEAIRLFLAYASFMGFMVYQMDSKRAFIYGTIKEEVYVCQPLGFKDPNYPDKVYVDDIIFGSTNKELCKAFEKLMKYKFQMSSIGELTFFLGLQVKKKDNRIFISQDKYVAEILRKFGLTDGKLASTPIDTEKPLLKDPDGEDVDIVDFLTAHPIQYALMVNPAIYVSCNKQFWAFVLIKKSNDAVKLQALIDRKKVIITEDKIQKALRLVDADGIDCLTNEEIFDELARMGYEKPSTKLTFYKAFFLAQRKFLIHTIDDAEVQEDEDDNEISVAPTPPLPTPATTPLPPQQEPIPSSPLAQSAQPLSPPLQQPSQTAYISKSSMPLLIKLMETCAILTKKRLEKKMRTKHSGLKRLKKLGTSQRVEFSIDTIVDDQEDAFKWGGIAELDANEDVTLEDVDDEVKMDANIQGRLAESQAKAYNLDLQHAKKVLSMQDTDEANPAEVEEVLEVVIAARLMTKVVTTAAQVPKASALRKRREPKPLKRQAQIEQDEAFARKLKAELNANINWNDVLEKVMRREKQDNTVMMYQALKRKPVTKAHARKNMMIYLKNMAGFKMDFFKGMTYNEIRPIYEKHYNFIQAFLEKESEELTEQEEGSKRKVNDDDDVNTEATPLASKVPVVDYEIHHKNNKPYYMIIKADGTHKLFLSFTTLLKNFNREDLEALWKIVKERFESTKPKNFSDDFLLKTFKILFKMPNIKDNVWRDQKGRYGLAKVKS